MVVPDEKIAMQEIKSEGLRNPLRSLSGEQSRYKGLALCLSLQLGRPTPALEHSGA